jgi:hypothetical protein
MSINDHMVIVNQISRILTEAIAQDKPREQVIQEMAALRNGLLKEVDDMVQQMELEHRYNQQFQ